MFKGCAIARGYAAPTGKNLAIIPAFDDVIIDGEKKTACKAVVILTN